MLDAALAVFAEKGYEGATLDEVAERAEFGKGTLYNYFPGGKTELFTVLFEEVVFGGVLGIIEQSFAAPDGFSTPATARETFRAFVAALVDHFRSHRDVLLLFMRGAHRMAQEEGALSLIAARNLRLIETLARPVEAAIGAGVLRPLPPVAVAHLLMGNVRGYLMAEVAACAPAAARPLPFETADEAADFITTVLFDGLLAPAAPDA